MDMNDTWKNTIKLAWPVLETNFHHYTCWLILCGTNVLRSYVCNNQALAIRAA